MESATFDVSSVPLFATSTSTAKLDEALAKAQGEVENAIKDAFNPHFKSKYADLAGVYDACRDALSKHGISHTQWPLHSDDDHLHIVTRLAHAGEWILARMSLPVTKNDAQGYGSALTYARRYALTAAVGVAADDDDGNAASANAPQRTATKGKKPPKIEAPPRDAAIEDGRTEVFRVAKLVLEKAKSLGWDRDLATLAGQALGKPWDQHHDRTVRYSAQEYEEIRRALVVELELLEAEEKLRAAAEAEMGAAE